MCPLLLRLLHLHPLKMGIFTLVTILLRRCFIWRQYTAGKACKMVVLTVCKRGLWLLRQEDHHSLGPCGLSAPANAKVMLALLLHLLILLLLHLLLLLLVLSSPSKGRSVSWPLCGRDAANADVMLHSPGLSDGRPRRHQIGWRKHQMVVCPAQPPNKGNKNSSSRIRSVRLKPGKSSGKGGQGGLLWSCNDFLVDSYWLRFLLWDGTVIKCFLKS